MSAAVVPAAMRTHRLMCYWSILRFNCAIIHGHLRLFAIPMQVWQLPATPLSAYASARSTADPYASARSMGDLPASKRCTAEEGLGFCHTHKFDSALHPGGRQQFAPLSAAERQHSPSDHVAMQQLSVDGGGDSGPRQRAAPSPTLQRPAQRLPAFPAAAATKLISGDYNVSCQRPRHGWQQQQQPGALPAPRHGQVIMTTPEWAAQQRQSARRDAAQQPAHRQWAPEQQGADAALQQQSRGEATCGGAPACASWPALQQPDGRCDRNCGDGHAEMQLQSEAAASRLLPNTGQYGYAAMALRRQHAASEAAAAAAAAAAAEAQRSGSHDAGVQCTLLRPHDPSRQQLRHSSGSQADAAAVRPPLVLPLPALPASAPACRDLLSVSRGLAAGGGGSSGGGGGSGGDGSGATGWQQEAATSGEPQQEVTPALLPAHWRGLARPGGANGEPPIAPSLTRSLNAPAPLISSHSRLPMFSKIVHWNTDGKM